MRVSCNPFVNARRKEITKRKLNCFFVVLILGLVLMTHPVCAEERNCTFINSNENAQDYGIYWSNCMKSFLAEDEAGYYRSCLHIGEWKEKIHKME